MAHGQPDHSVDQRARTIYRVTDVGELAARLGSICTFDRRGDVIWLDDFESNIDKWFTNLEGAGGSIALSPDTARSGGLSCKIVTGNVAGNEAQISRYSHYPVLSRVGFEISMTFHTAIDYVQMTSAADDGTDLLLAAIRYYPNTATIKYNTSAGAWADLATDINFYWAINCFNSLKLVVDFDTKKYVRLIAGNQEIDMSTLSIQTTAFANHYFLVATLITAPKANVSATHYVDDAIQTQNE